MKFSFLVAKILEIAEKIVHRSPASLFSLSLTYDVNLYCVSKKNYIDVLLTLVPLD